MMPNRRREVIAGVLFLVATLAYGTGNGLVGANPGEHATIGVFLQLVAATANVFIGVLLYRTLKRESDTVAVGYLVTRIFDGAGVALGGALLPVAAWSNQAAIHPTSSLTPMLMLGHRHLFSITMMALGLGSIPMCALLVRSRLVPAWLGLLGIAGYAALLLGSVAELFDVNSHMLHYAVGGVFEIIFPAWLVAKGLRWRCLRGSEAG